MKTKIPGGGAIRAGEETTSTSTEWVTIGGERNF